MNQTVTDSPPIRLLIAEDSPTCRELLVTIFQNAVGIQVVGTARDGAEAVRLTKRLRPDVVTMDLLMPQMDGYQATRQIMAEFPCPIVMVTGQMNNNEAELMLNALQAGALSVLARPTMGDNQDGFVQQIKLMAGVKVVRRRLGPRPLPPSLPPLQQTNSQIQLVVMAASTGGPGALATILSQMPAHFPAPILISQHITPGFSSTLASWLNKQTKLNVRLAQHGTILQATDVLLAPDGYHLLLSNQGTVALQKRTAHELYCPSADLLFASAAQLFGKTAVGVMLTGMGQDGAKGMLAMRQTGAFTIVQDEESSLIFGMPAAAIHLNAQTTIQPLANIASTIVEQTTRPQQGEQL